MGASATDVMTLKKPNEAIVMLPRIGRLTTTSRKLYNFLLYFTHQQVQEITSQQRTVDAGHLFQVELSALVRPLESGESDLRTLVKQYLREMRRIEIDWEAPDASTGVVWNNMSLLSQCKIEIVDRVTYVKWALPPELFQSIRDMERFTLLDLNQQAKLKSYAAVALYEICARYKNNPSGLTSSSHPDWWVEALTHKPSIDAKTGERKIREWRKVKNEHVNGAIIEINSKTDLDIKMVEKKVGRAVVEVQFEVRRKRSTGDKKVGPTLSPQLAERATRSDIPLSDVRSLVRGGVSETVVGAALNKLEKRVARSELGDVNSPAAYLRTVVREISDMVGDQSPCPPTTAVTVPSGSQFAPAGSEYRNRRMRELKIELFALSKSEQRVYADSAFEALRSRNVLSPRIVANYNDGRWESGSLASEMVVAFAVDRYGVDWDRSHG